MSEEWLFVCLEFFPAVYSAMHLPQPWFPKSGPFLLPALFTLVLPRVSPTKSVDYSTWLMLNCSCKMMCLFINTNAGPLVYCTHGSNQLLNKYCFVCGCEQQFILQGLGGGKKKNNLKCRDFDKGEKGNLSLECGWNGLRFAFLISHLDEGARKISKLFGFSKRFP